MTEQEIKDTVEQIVKREADEKRRRENDDLIEASVCTKAVCLLETELEQQGYFLGESGSDMIVYHATCLKQVKDEWMRFDRLEWKWRQPCRDTV